MKKTIIIEEHDENYVTIETTKNLQWNTFIIGIEMLLEVILKKGNTGMSLDEVLADVKRIYLRDNGENKE